MLWEESMDKKRRVGGAVMGWGEGVRKPFTKMETQMM